MKRDDSARRPRSLGISAPEGKDVHEFYLRVASRPSILGKISNVFGARGIDILGVHGQVSDDKKTADLLFYVEMEGSTAPAAEVVEELRRQDYVVEANAEPRSRVYFDDRAFPLTSGGHYRVFVLGANGWAALVRSLMNRFGSGGDVILQEEGVALGKELVGRIGNRFPSPDPSVMVANLKALFAASGLGVLDVLPAGNRVERFTVTIGEHPASGAGDGKGLVDHFLIGIVKGAVGGIYAQDYWVKDAVCKEDGTLTFELVSA